MTGDLSDEEVVKRRAKRIGVERLKWQNDLRALMSMKEGKRVLWQIMERSRMLSPDLFINTAHDMAYRVGQRDLGVWLYNELVLADEGLFIEMLVKENRADE